MGLASSLNCAGMCGAIATSLRTSFDPGAGPAARLRTHFAAQSGRVFVYALGGGLLGGAGAAFYGAFDHVAAYLALRWAAAVALGWISLTVTARARRGGPRDHGGGGAERGGVALDEVATLDMRGACAHHNRMPVMVQIRNMPEDLHRTLKSRAALAGKSLSEYLLSELKHSAEKPTLEEMRERLAQREPFNPPMSTVDILREERDKL